MKIIALCLPVCQFNFPAPSPPLLPEKSGALPLIDQPEKSNKKVFTKEQSIYLT